MICCLVGGALLAIMTQAARAGRGRNGGDLHRPLAALFGFAAGLFLLELFVTVLAPFGIVQTNGGLALRLSLLAIPAVVAVASLAAGAANGLEGRPGLTLLGLTVAAGALAAEELDLHVLDLHDPRNLFAWVAVHLAVLAVPVACLLAGRHAGQERAACCPAAKDGPDADRAPESEAAARSDGGSQLSDTGTSGAPQAQV